MTHCTNCSVSLSLHPGWPKYEPSEDGFDCELATGKAESIGQTIATVMKPPDSACRKEPSRMSGGARGTSVHCYRLSCEKCPSCEHTCHDRELNASATQEPSRSPLRGVESAATAPKQKEEEV